MPIPPNSPYHQMQANCMVPNQVQSTGSPNPTAGIPPQLLMAAAMQQDRPLPPSFGSAVSQPEPPNPLFRKEAENVTKSPSVSPIQCSSPPASSNE